MKQGACVYSTDILLFTSFLLKYITQHNKSSESKWIYDNKYVIILKDTVK